jgi:hypothetical protein
MVGKFSGQEQNAATQYQEEADWKTYPNEFRKHACSFLVVIDLS